PPARPMRGGLYLGHAAAAAKPSRRLPLNTGHLAVCVQVEANLASSSETPGLLNVDGVDGAAKFSLYVSSGGTLALDNGIAATTRTSSTVFGSGWHPLERPV